jgi:N-methylhydantoinase B/oxoprolinase/acetone carboxylase alpha subunit
LACTRGRPGRVFDEAERYEFEVTDAGAGRHRGGRGLICEYRSIADDVTVTATFGRHKSARGASRAVAEDVRDGYVTPEQARATYGVDVRAVTCGITCSPYAASVASLASCWR